jgi:hypothetical protein
MTVSKSSGKRHLPDLDQELNVESLSNIDTALTSPVRGDQPGGSDMSVEEESNERTERTEKEEGGEPQKNGIGLPSPIQGDQPEGLDIIVLLKIVERRILIMRKVIWNQMVVGVYLVIN